MSRYRGLLILTAVAAAAAWANSAQAQGYGGGYGGWGGFYGFNAGAGPYNLYDNERVVPHFALYPPVYYSVPIPRTYGWSPFAYPPGMMTPEVATPQPLEIENPQVPQKTSTTTANRTARAPLVIDNPFVVRAVPGGNRPADSGPAVTDRDASTQLSSTRD
jgi:hypothetical protein